MKIQTLTIVVSNGKHAGLRDIKGRPDNTGAIVARNGIRWIDRGGQPMKVNADVAARR